MQHNKGGVHVCFCCWNKSFCNDCIEVHKVGMFAYKKCDPMHEFVYVMDPPGKMRPDQMKVNGETVDIEKWLNVIRRY
jgi:hypothetical protein